MSKYTDISKIDFFSLSVEEGMRLPAIGAEDAPVVVHCGGYEKRWNSRAVCTAFYKAANVACEGSSEGRRYTAIYLGLMFGDAVPSDGEPLRKPENTKPLTEEEAKRLARLRVSKEEAAARLDALRAANAPSEEIAKAFTRWNDLAIEIISLEKRERAGRPSMSDAA